MPYPQTLLPKKQFKKIECDLSAYLLIRKTLTKDIINPSTETLRDEVITLSEIHLIDFSTNLLGHFELDYLQYSIVGNDRKYYFSYWDFSSEVRTPIINIDFELSKQYGYFLLPVKVFHGLTFPFKKGDRKDYTATLLVTHKPTNCNFWHFEIGWHVLDSSGIPIAVNKNSKAEWQLSLAGVLKSKIKFHFESLIPSQLNYLPSSEYKK